MMPDVSSDPAVDRTPAGRVIAALHPLLSAWIVAAYVHGAQYLFINRYVDEVVAGALFLPVVLLEYALGRGWPPRLRRADRKGLNASFILALLFWLGFYVAWVGVFGWYGRGEAKWLVWLAPQFYLQFYLVFRAEGWLTWVMFGAWVAVYALVTVRGGRLRLVTTMVLPMVMGLGLFVHLYNRGGIGALREGSVPEQPGVTRVMDIRAMHPVIPQHPRGICHDAKHNALLVMFGCTYCNDLVHYPTVVRYDLANGSTHTFTSANIRQVDCTSEKDTLLVAPWYRQQVYELNRKDLSTVAIFPTRVDALHYWEPMNVVQDGEMLYITNDVEQALVAYNTRTFQAARVLNLVEQGWVRYGGPAWNLVQSRKSKKLYFTTGPGENLFEVEPGSLRILKHRSFFDVTGTALEIDDERGVLYYQNGGLTDDLHEIDVETFDIKRTYEGEGHARQVILDRGRNRLYVLGYFSGTVFALDRDSGRRIWTRRVGGLPHGMALHKDTLWINSRPGVVELDLSVIDRNP